MTKIKKRKNVLFSVILVMCLVLAISAAVRGKKGASQETVNSSVQTEEVSRRDLMKTIGTTGTIVSKKSRDISVNLTGTEIVEVCVKEGDRVKKGERLIVFDTTDAAKNLADAKETLENFQRKSELSQQDAARNVNTAETTREYQIATAKDAKALAYSEYKSAKKVYKKEKKELEELRKEEASAKKAYATRKDSSLKTACDAAVANRELQEEVVVAAKKQVRATKSTYQTQKKTYQQTIAAQNSTVEAAKSSRQSVRLSQDTSTQEAQVRQYQKQVDNGILYAPFDGVITTVNYEEGEVYTSGAVVTLQDCSDYEVEAEIGEYDISDVKEGQEVIIKTNATGEEEMTGRVKSISSVSTSSGNSVMGANGISSASTAISDSDIMYQVRISIEKPSDRLKLDMSANLSIIIEKHENALTIPYNTVQTDTDGQSFVTVVKEDGSTENLDVNVIMESNYYTEISSQQLQEGMKVSVTQEEESNNPFEYMSHPEGGF